MPLSFRPARRRDHSARTTIENGGPYDPPGGVHGDTAHMGETGRSRIPLRPAPEKYMRITSHIKAPVASYIG